MSVRAAPPLSRSTLALLRRVRHACREGWLLEDRLAQAAGAAVADARRQHAPAMQLVVALRHAWADVPELPELPKLLGVDAPDARDLLNHLVTACVHAYYGEHYDESRDGSDQPGTPGDMY